MKFVVRGGLFDEHVDIYAETDQELAELIAAHPNLGHEDTHDDGPLLELTMQAYRNFCEGIVAAAPDKVNVVGTEEAFASEVLKYFGKAQRCVEDGDAASAAHYAFYAGWKFEQMRLKFSFEGKAKTGAKTHKRLYELRTKQNTEAKAEVRRRRKAIAMLVRKTRLTGGALDEWLRRQLWERFAISVSTRTIRGDRKALRG